MVGRGASSSGGGGGGNKAAVKDPRRVRTQARSNNCVVCRLTTNTIPSNKAGAVMCCVCDTWWHPACAQLTPEMFELITKWTEAGKESPWKCQSCEGAGAKILKIVNVLSAKVVENEKVLSEHSGRLDRFEDKEKLQDSRLDCQQKEIDELRDQLIKLGDTGGPSTLREMDERNEKENNLVLHRVGESGDGDARRRIDHDKKFVQQLLNVIGVGEGVGVERDIKFVRRLGPRVSDGDREEKRDPRPLLVGLVHKYHSELILENCWKLADTSNEAMRVVSVVRDLTQRQRAGERELYKEAARKNLVRSQEQQQENMAFKVVGRRGAKREILAPLRAGEAINTAGEVIWVREEGGTLGGRGTARGGGRPGPAPASYQNCVLVGNRGGTGTNPDTAQDRMLGQRVANGRGGGRGRGGGVTFGSRAGGSRDQLREEGRSGGGAVGRGGTVRQREVSRSPTDRRCPPGKKVDGRDSPRSDSRNNSTPLIVFDQDKPPREREGVYDEYGEVVDDAVVVVDEVEEVF